MSNDGESLLPLTHSRSAKGDRDAPSPSSKSSCSSFIRLSGRHDAADPSQQRAQSWTETTAFRVYVICSMTVIWTFYTLAVRQSRALSTQELLYASTTVVLCAEFVKCAITLSMIFLASGCRVARFSKIVSTQFIGEPGELLRMSLPSLAYALQNNLDFVALHNLDAGVYQVTTQLKVVSTALFMMLFLGRRFSGRRWSAILLLGAGVALVQISASQSASSASSADKGGAGKQENYALGLTAVLATCATAGFAGVYFEMMLKKPVLPDKGNASTRKTLPPVNPQKAALQFWLCNLRMYSWGVLLAGIAVFVADREAVVQKGLFYGYNQLVLLVVVALSVGGIYISLVMRYLDNLHKSFASAVSIILVISISRNFLAAAGTASQTPLGAQFVIGTGAVCGAILLYNSVKE